MKKCNLSKNLLSLVFLCMAVLSYANNQHINLLFNDVQILNAQNIAEEEKALSILLKERSSKIIEEIHITVDCQDEQIYVEDTIDMKRVIKQADQGERDIWIFVETLKPQGKSLQECIDQILIDTIGNNYQLYDPKIFSGRQKFNANIDEKQNALPEKLFTIFSFVSSSPDEPKYSSTLSNENRHFDIKGIKVLQQGSDSTEIILILALGVLVLLGFGVFIFLKKRKNTSSGNSAQRNVERQKFIPRSQGSFDSRLDQSKSSFSEGVLSQKRTLPAVNTEDINQVLPKLFTPNFKGANLKLDDKVPVINDNMFNHIETPRSVEDLGSHKEVKDTPKGVDFNIEFSIVESDPKGSVTRG